MGFWYTELLERNAQFKQWCAHDRPKVRQEGKKIKKQLEILFISGNSQEMKIKRNAGILNKYLFKFFAGNDKNLKYFATRDAPLTNN